MKRTQMILVVVCTLLSIFVEKCTLLAENEGQKLSREAQDILNKKLLEFVSALDSYEVKENQEEPIPESFEQRQQDYAVRRDYMAGFVHLPFPRISSKIGLYRESPFSV